MALPRHNHRAQIYLNKQKEKQEKIETNMPQQAEAQRTKTQSIIILTDSFLGKINRAICADDVVLARCLELCPGVTINFI